MKSQWTSVQRHPIGLLASAFAIAAGYLAAPYASADQVIADDLRVQGGLCVGTDCANGKDFADYTAILAENNVRLRLWDSRVGGVLGESWNLKANNSGNGSLNHFAIEQKSISKDAVQVSDGTAPVYDCSELVVNYGQTLPVVPGAYIPWGEPVIAPVQAEFFVEGGVTKVRYECTTVADYSRVNGAWFGPVASGAVALGDGSKPVAGTVSVGDVGNGLLRQLKHLADAVESTDLITVGALKAHEFDSLVAQIAELEGLVADLSSRLDEIESTDTDGDGTIDVLDPFPGALTGAVAGSFGLEVIPADASSTCSVAQFQLESLTGLSEPPGGVFVWYGQAVNFTLDNCAVGEQVEVVIDLGAAPSAGYAGYKVDADGWQVIPGARIEGSLLRYTITDGGPLDADGAANGSIVDPVAIARSSVAVPGLSGGALWMLAALLGWIGLRAQQAWQGSVGRDRF